jgi:hypothetical protein
MYGITVLGRNSHDAATKNQQIVFIQNNFRMPIDMRFPTTTVECVHSAPTDGSRVRVLVFF